MSFRRFRQSTDDQVATLFGVEVEGDTDHYLVATAGDVQIDGWSVGIGGDLSRHVRGQVHYSLGQAAWMHRVRGGSARPCGALGDARRPRVHPRPDDRDFRDLPSTSTEVSFVYRMSSAFSQTGAVSRLPGFDGGFDLEVHQAAAVRATPRRQTRSAVRDP